MSLPNEMTELELPEEKLEEVVGGYTEPLPPTCQVCTSGSDPKNIGLLYEGVLLG